MNTHYLEFALLFCCTQYITNPKNKVHTNYNLCLLLHHHCTSKTALTCVEQAVDKKLYPVCLVYFHIFEILFCVCFIELIQNQQWFDCSLEQKPRYLNVVTSLLLLFVFFNPFSAIRYRSPFINTRAARVAWIDAIQLTPNSFLVTVS